MKKYISLSVLFLLCLSTYVYSAAVIDTQSPYRGNYMLVYNQSTDTAAAKSTGTLPSGSMLMGEPLLGAEDLSGINGTVKGIREIDGKKIYELEYKDNFKASKTALNLPLGNNVLNSRSLNAVGNTRNFNVHDFYYNTPYTLTATSMYSGTRCDVFVENSYTTSIDSTKAATLGQEFDNNISQFMMDNFGDYYVNGNGHIVLLLYDIRDAMYYDTNANSYMGGYFNAADLVPIAYGGNGNLCSMINIDIYPTLSSKASPVMSNAFSTTVHELQHSVSFADYWSSQNQQDFNESWLNEGFSMAAEHMKYGTLTDRITGVNTSAAVRDGAILTYKDYADNNNDVRANYGLPYLFGQYLRTQTNGLTGGGNAIFKTILSSDNYDYLAVQDGLSSVGYSVTDFATFQKNFRLAMLLKEASGVYGFKGDTAFSTLNYPIYTGTGVSLKGSGAVIKALSTAFTPSGANADIKFVGVNNNPIAINSLKLADINGTQLSSLTSGQTVYVTAGITGYASGAKVVLSVYNNKKLIKVSLQDYTTGGTYKTSYVLPQSFNSYNCKAFVLHSLSSQEPAVNVIPQVNFNTYTIIH